MRTKKIDISCSERKEPAVKFERRKGDKSFNGEIEELKDGFLWFRTGNGKLMKIRLRDEQDFWNLLSVEERIDIAVVGKPGRYVLSRFYPNIPNAMEQLPDMALEMPT